MAPPRPVLCMGRSRIAYDAADGSYVGSMLNVSDVTGKRAAQNLALQTQKLEAIGEFSAGISHDFNNLLTSIIGYAELARAEVGDRHVARGDLEQVIDAAHRASAITAKLLAFSRQQVLRSVAVVPSRIISDIVPILHPLLGDGIELMVDAPADEIDRHGAPGGRVASSETAFARRGYAAMMSRSRPVFFAR